MKDKKNKILALLMGVLLTGCYTALRESSEYYADFRGTDVVEESDQADSASYDESDDSTIDDQAGQAIVIERYYSSPWCPPYYPYSGWWVSVGYAPGYVHFYDPYWSWGSYAYGYDYYWAGCGYPTYPAPDYYYPRSYYPVYSSRRSYGVRTPVLNPAQNATAISVANQRATGGAVRFKNVQNTSASASKQKATKSRSGNRRTYRPKSTQTRSGHQESKARSPRGRSNGGSGREIRRDGGSNRSGKSGSGEKRSGSSSNGKRKYN